MKRIILACLLLAAALALPATVLWNDAVPIRQGVNIEWFRTGTETSDGGAIYVWSDTKLGERDLWCQKVDAAGNLVWGEPLLVDGKPDRQEDPVITRTSDNNYIIAWIDFSDDLDGNVYAQKVNNQGQLQWQAGGKPVCTYSEVQISLNIEADANGGAYIIWSDSRNPSKDLYGQHLDASGNPVNGWAVNGIPIANGTGDEEQNTMLPDGQGGMMIGYTHSYVGAEDIYVKRFNSDGTMAWPQILVLSDAPGNQSGVRMASIGGGEFIFTWHDQRNTDPDIYAQKVNLAGQMLWGNPFMVYGDSGQPGFSQQLNPRIVATSDGGAIIVWEDNRLDDQNPDLFGQKVNSAGNLLWGAAGVQVSVAEFAQSGVRLDSDGAGGCFAVWDDFRNGNVEDIYAQHISSTGASSWEANGKAVCNVANQQLSGLVKVSGGNVFINWMDIRNGSVGIYYQVYNPAGTALLETNGKVVFWGLSGDTPLGGYQLLTRDNDAVAIWQDTRFANLGYQIYCQFLNSDGSVALETNGRPVTAGTSGDQITPNAAIGPNGQIAVVWEDKRGDNPKIYAQLLDAAGNRLWGDLGLEITDNSPLRQKDPKIAYIPSLGGYFIGWSSLDSVSGSFFYHVYGQMILNNQKQWGPNGIMISALGATELNNECVLNDLKGQYYVWERYNPAEGIQNVYVQKINGAGAADTGWPTEGLKVSTHNSWDTLQRLPVSLPTPQGIYVMWRDGRNDFIQNYYGQHVSSAGQRLWDPLGVNLADYGREQEQPTIVNDDTEGDAVIFAWCENIEGYHDIVAQKYSLAGSALWGDLGHYVVQKDSTQTSPSLAHFDGSSMAIAWSDYQSMEADIYYKYMLSDGTFLGAIGGDVLCAAGKSQYNPLLAASGNSAYAIWADGRSSGKTEILGLYAQRISGTTVANDDPTAPGIHSLELLQNYPNPFNPNTNISFVVKNAAAEHSLAIYNLKGQLVKTLAQGRLEKGKHTLSWDGTDARGNTVSSGVYRYVLSSGGESVSKRMVLIK